MSYEVIINALLGERAIRATKYVSSKLIIRVVRRTFKGKIKRGNVEMLLTIGKPNYQERQFIKDCKKAGVIFPVKKIQFKYPKV